MTRKTHARALENQKTSALVVHPLFDVPEQKLSTEDLPRMRMTLSVRLSLVALRAYLILMTVMVAYHVLDLAGAFKPHAP